MKVKKFLIVIFCFIFAFSSFFVVSAKNEYELVYSISAEDVYNYFLNSSNSYLFVTDYYLSDGVFYCTTTSSFTLYGSSFGFTDLSKGNTYYIECVGTNVTANYRNFSNIAVKPGSLSYEGDDIKRPGVSFVGNCSFYSFSLFNVYEVPDNPEPQGDSSDFGTFIVPLVTDCVHQTWNAVVDCWWAMAFLFIPFVFLLIFLVLDIFRKFQFSFNTKYKKFPYIKPDYKFKIPFKKNKFDYVYVDGQTYLRKSGKKQKFDSSSSSKKSLKKAFNEEMKPDYVNPKWNNKKELNYFTNIAKKCIAQK